MKKEESRMKNLLTLHRQYIIHLLIASYDMITFPNAKINLGLHITEKRSDGYHNLETVFYPIPLHDALEIHPAPPHSNERFTLHCSGIALEGDPQHNLVAKAYLLLQKSFQLPPISIHLFKHIPSGAGMGGGSADAAFMLKLLNERFDLGLSLNQLEDYAARLGADCPFFIRNAPTLATGIGNVFSPLSLSLTGYQLLVVTPSIFVSTREAFSLITPREPCYSLRNIIEQPIQTWKDRLINDFEASVFPQFPAIEQIKEELYVQGAIYASMSGSGSSVFGIFAPDATLPDVSSHPSYKLVL